jgi:hypothetical protein
MAYISRDPFARTELHRNSVRITGNQTCRWCGQTRYMHGQPIPFLFEYRTESDGGRVSEHSGLFCSKSCHDAYHS